MKYAVQPVIVVDAFAIAAVSPFRADGSIDLVTGEDGKNRAASFEMLKKHNFIPVPGDYWVIQDGAESMARKAAFEAKHAAFQSGVTP